MCTKAFIYSIFTLNILQYVQELKVINNNARKLSTNTISNPVSIQSQTQYQQNFKLSINTISNKKQNCLNFKI